MTLPEGQHEPYVPADPEEAEVTASMHATDVHDLATQALRARLGPHDPTISLLANRAADRVLREELGPSADIEQ